MCDKGNFNKHSYFTLRSKKKNTQDIKRFLQQMHLKDSNPAFQEHGEWLRLEGRKEGNKATHKGYNISWQTDIRKILPQGKVRLCSGMDFINTST